MYTQNFELVLTFDRYIAKMRNILLIIRYGIFRMK